MKTDEIEEVLTRGVEKILPDKKGLAELLRKKKIKLYLGIDPTGSRLHLGHAIPLRKLQQFANLGHNAILLFGTGTILAGDPSQREHAREMIAAEQIKHNISTWKEQVKSIIDFNKVNIMYNGEWLLRLTLKDIIEIASNISAVKLFKRNMFQKRIKQGDTIWTHEMLYPLLQGYDSVAMDVDLEIGGTDQTFNMLIGRELQEKMNNREKYVLSVLMILGSDGNPMSKTSGNCIWLTDSPKDMYGKIMSLQDNLIIQYFELCTDIPLQSIKQYEKSIKVKPMELKKKLAWEIVKMYHGKGAADKAQKEFERVFQKRQLPERVRSLELGDKSWNIVDLLMETKLVKSKSEAKRLITQGAVEVNQSAIRNPQSAIQIKDGMIIRVGKKRFVKVKSV